MMDSLIVTMEKRDWASDRTHRTELSCGPYYSIGARKYGFLAHRSMDSTESLVFGSFPKCEAPPVDLSPRCALPYEERKRLVQLEEKGWRRSEIVGRGRLESTVGARSAREITSGEGGRPERHASKAKHETAPPPDHQESYVRDHAANNSARWYSQLYAKVTKKARRRRWGRKGRKKSCGSSYFIDDPKHSFLAHRSTDSTESLVFGSFPGRETPPMDLSPRCALPYEERKHLVQLEEKGRRGSEIAGRVRPESIVGACRAREITSGEGGGPEGNAAKAKHETAPPPGRQESYATEHATNNSAGWCSQLYAKVTKKERRRRRGRKGGKTPCGSYYSIDAGKHSYLAHRSTDSTESLVFGSFPKCEAPPMDLSPRCALPYEERKRLTQLEEKGWQRSEIAGRGQLKSIVGACRAREIMSGKGGGPEGNVTKAKYKTAPSPGHQKNYATDYAPNKSVGSYSQLYAKVAKKARRRGSGRKGGKTPAVG